MALQKNWLAVSPRPFTANGTSLGVVTVAKTKGFYVKQKVYLKSNTINIQKFEVKRVISKTQLWVGPVEESLKVVSDISNFLLADAAYIEAHEQPRFSIPLTEHERAVYEEDPVVAKRVTLVDEIGDKYTVDNPLPVQLSDGSITIETVNANISVQLTAKDNDPKPGDIHDSVRIGDGSYEVKVNSDGSINVNLVGINVPSTPIIVNVSMPLAGTQYSFTFPTGTKRYNLYVRGNAKLQFCFITGQTNTKYRTLEMGASYTEESILNSAPLPIYFQASQPGKILEILYWT
jgi:hypothetical protein